MYSAIDDGAPAECGRERALMINVCLERGAAGSALEPARVGIESPQSIELLRTPELRLTHRLLEHTQCLVVDLEGDGEWMPVLTAVRE